MSKAPKASKHGGDRPTPSADGLSRLQRLTYRVWLAVGLLVLGAVTLWLLYRPLAVILAPILLALLIVYLLDPVVSALRRRGVPRFFGTLLAYLVVASVIAGAVTALTPMVSMQVRDFADAAPELGETLRTETQAVADRLGIVVDLRVEAVAQEVQDFVAEAENRELLVAILGGLSGAARGALYVLAAVLLGPIIAFYILVDLPNLRRMTRNVVPPSYRAEVVQVTAKLGRVVGGFVRGQLVIALAIGVAASLALWIIGLPYWLLIGIVAGITNIIPLIGPFVAGVLGVSIALLTEGVGFALLTALVMTGVQQIDGQLMSPLILGRTVRVHPLAVLLGIIVAGALYGVFGMLLVVPLIAGIKVLLQHAWYTRVPWAGDMAGHREPALTASEKIDERPAGAATPQRDDPQDRPGEPTDPDAEPGGEAGLSDDAPATARR